MKVQNKWTEEKAASSTDNVREDNGVLMPQRLLETGRGEGKLKIQTKGLWGVNWKQETPSNSEQPQRRETEKENKRGIITSDHKHV